MTLTPTLTLTLILILTLTLALPLRLTLARTLAITLTLTRCVPGARATSWVERSPIRACPSPVDAVGIPWGYHGDTIGSLRHRCARSPPVLAGCGSPVGWP